MSKNKSGAWSFFASVQLAIVLLSLIALFALIGTLVPQREAAVEFGARLSPSVFSFLQKMQIFDLYHSIWFILLSGLLAVNLLICSLDRFPLAWRRFRMSSAPQNEEAFKKQTEDNVLQTSTDAHQAADSISALLKKKYNRLKRHDDADGIFLSAQKGRFSLFGVYIVHTSILVLIVGAVIGSLFGVEGYVNINEGDTATAISVRGEKRELPLPFSVRCDKFTVAFYESGMPKTFQSDLTFLQDGQPVVSEKLRVNAPIEFAGFRFYQASYGALAGGKATLALSRPGNRRDVMNVAQGYDFSLPGKEGIFHILRVEENMMNMGPAVKIAVRSGKSEETVFWIFQQIDQMMAMNPGIVSQVPLFNPGRFRPYTFQLLGLEEKYYTGLQVSRDPGTPVVAVGAVLLIGGLMLILFSYARSVFVRIQQKNGRVFVAVAGKSYKNSSGLQREIQYLRAEIKDRLEKSK